MLQSRCLSRIDSRAAFYLASSSGRRYDAHVSLASFCYSSTYVMPFSSSRSALQATFKVAIVGSGPSGCYTAKYLKASNKKSSETPEENAQMTPKWSIDVLDRLPTPYGLVRSGVAPDHPEVKNVQNDFDSLFESSDEEATIQFFGNVRVGEDVTLEELRQRYDAVVLAYGCESDRSLAHLPGASGLTTVDAEGGGPILSAREFVSWYNGHVDFEWVGPIVAKALSPSTSNTTTQDIVVVGHGNVALDCARILAKTRDELDPTDVASRALDILRPLHSDASPRRITIVGRRGHVQGAFTIKELRELTKLPHADFIVRKDELEMGKATPASQEEYKSSRPKTRIDKLLTDASSKEETKEVDQVHLRFLMNPIGFEPAESEKALAGVICERTKLSGDAGAQQAEGTGEKETIPAQLALISIGYKGVAIPGTEAWFDEQRGTLMHKNGLVAEVTEEQGGVYTAGWLKRGPSGIIGTNIADAKDTVATILQDLQSHKRGKKSDTSSLEDLLRDKGVKFVDWEGYQKIDQTETRQDLKRHPDQPREKLTTTASLLQAAEV